MNRGGRFINIKSFSFKKGAPLAILFLSGCSLFSSSGIEVGPTLQELEPARMPDQELPIQRISLEQVEESYRQALVVAEDTDTRRKILVRLADLEMRRAEQKMLDSDQVVDQNGSQYFNKAIDLHLELLATSAANHSTNISSAASPIERDKLTYQLAKAYALDGRMQESAQVLDKIAGEYPNSAFIAEAEFRRAERAFSQKDYGAAEQGYDAVISQGDGTPFYANAIYMRGWSQFKRNRYQASMQSFSQVLDGLSQQSPDLSSVSKVQQSLLDDTLRVMSLVASYLGGAESLHSVYQPLGERAYVYLLYRRLGELYLEKRRYRDSAETYKQFVAHYPDSDHAPSFSVDTIDVYVQGNFPSLVLPAKEAFVRHYGVGSDYWQKKSDTVHQELRPHLRSYLDELAKYQHAKAQQLQQSLLTEERSKKLSKTKRKLIAAQADQHFLQAADWYREFIRSFPNDPQALSMQFLMAEALFDASRFDQAFNAYQIVAYHNDHSSVAEKAADAGYGAVIAAEKHLLTLAEPQAKQQWKDNQISAGLRFSESFPKDTRAVKVLAQAAKELLLIERTPEAIAAATRLVEWQPQVDILLQQSAWLIIGQGSFDVEDYNQAELAYREVLTILPAKDERRQDIVERIAASIYRQAEQQLAQDNPQQAIGQWLRIRELAPHSDIAIKAQYDALNQLMTLQDWPEAKRVALDFRQRYPRHTLTPSLAAKLVLIYESLEAWSLAANELIGISTRAEDSETKRKSLYLAADYYRRANQTNDAITYFRQYAHVYPQPFTEVMEARFAMVELYQQTGDSSKRKFWLKKLIEGDRGAGEQRDPRSRYLAAYASSEFAIENYQAFVDVPLSLPLKSSLKKKKRLLKKALTVYEDVLAYEVAEFTTLASFHIGSIYAQLSQDLIASQRPANLDELALEQYEILLEEQAYPFEEQAIDIHQANAQRSWDGIYDQWVKRSFLALSELLPARYRKPEQQLEYTDAIF